MALPSYSTVSGALQSAQVIANKKPKYLRDAAKRKFGRRIFIVGSTEDEIQRFWDQVHYKAVRFDDRPKPIGRAVIDIDVKSHCNFGNEVDHMEITTKKTSNQKRTKTYQLSLGKSWTFQAGANLNIDAKFFNVAGVGIGGNTSLSRTKTTNEAATDEAEEALGQEFGIIEKLEILPKTKVKATITTWAITYESRTQVEVRVDRQASIPVRFRSSCQQVAGGICTSLGVITAEEIFRANGQEVHRENDTVWFLYDSAFSYLGEELEVVREQLPLPEIDGTTM